MCCFDQLFFSFYSPSFCIYNLAYWQWFHGRKDPESSLLIMCVCASIVKCACMFYFLSPQLKKESFFFPCQWLDFSANHFGSGFSLTNLQHCNANESFDKSRSHFIERNEEHQIYLSHRQLYMVIYIVHCTVRRVMVPASRNNNVKIPGVRFCRSSSHYFQIKPGPKYC